MMEGTVWSFWTNKFEIRLVLYRIWDYQYDGDDENGVIQSVLNNGDLVAFDSIIEVVRKGIVIGSDSLCGSVYHLHDYPNFWKAHRDPTPVNRNCSIMRKLKGDITVCHYFPYMVRIAIEQARLNPAFD